MTLGRDAMSFDWGDHRKKRWAQIAASMLGAERYVGACTALLNLATGNASSEKDIPREAMEAGFAERVWPVLQEVRPRLLSPLTNTVWDVMAGEVERRREPFPPCPEHLSREPVVFRLDGSPFLTLFVKPHNHPSRPQTDEQIADLGRACQWFLAESEGAGSA